MGKLIERISVLVIGLLVLGVLAAFLAPQAGWHINTVMSGSMEPAISTGDLIISAPVVFSDIRTGDVVVFKDTKGYVCHRVISVNAGSPAYLLTKGDANKGPDSTAVAPENIIGKVAFHIPFVGYLSNYIRTPLGLILTLVLPGLLIVGIELRKLLGEKSG